MEFEECYLSDICKYRKEKISTQNLKRENYISTDNMLPEKQGIGGLSDIPKSRNVDKFEIGDVLISNIRPYFKKIWFSDTNGGSSPDVLIFQSDEKKIIPEYLYYILSQDAFFSYMVQTSKGTKMPRGDKKIIMQYKVPLCKKEYQRRIVNFLSNLDKKIQTNKKIISNFEQLSRTLFKQWFVDFEFPNEEGNPYKSSGGEMKESELGEIPKNWVVNNLSNIAEIVMGQSPKSDTYNNEKIGLPLLNGATDFRNRMLSPSKYTSDAKKIGYQGDYVFGVRATIGLVTELDDTYAIGRGSGIAKALYPEQKEYLYEILNKAFDEFQYTASGSVYLNISKNDLMYFKICQPSFDIFKKYHLLVNTIIIQKENLKRQNKSLIQLRDTLLPKLLSGEIEIPKESEV